MRLFLIASAIFLAAAPVQAAGCQDRIAFVQSVIDNDRKVNFIGKEVYEVMNADLESARKACSAGDAGKANAIISGTQSRHGYPVR